YHHSNYLHSLPTRRSSDLIVPSELTVQEEKQGLSLEDKRVRNRIAEKSKQALLKQKPSPITSKASLDLIEIGNFEDDMERLEERSEEHTSELQSRFDLVCR